MSSISKLKIFLIALFVALILPFSVFATSPACPKMYSDYTFLLPYTLPEGVSLIHSSFLGTYTLVNNSSNEIYIGTKYSSEKEKTDWMTEWHAEEVPYSGNVPKEVRITTMLKNNQVLEMEKGQLILKPFLVGLDRSAIHFYGSGVSETNGNTCSSTGSLPQLKLELFSIPVYAGNSTYVIKGILLSLPLYLFYFVWLIPAVLLIVIAMVFIKKSWKKK